MRRKAVYDGVLDRQLRSVASDGISIFLLERGNLRGALLHGSYLVNQMRANHGLGVLETLVLGHAYIAVGLLTSQLKGNDRISLNISCMGPVKGFSVESSASGEIRGYLKQNPIPRDDVLGDFDIHLYSGDACVCTSYLEIHVAEEILSAYHISQDNFLLAIFNESDADTSNRCFNSHAGVHQR